MARQDRRLASLLFMLLALLSIRVLARVDNGQQPISYSISPNQGPHRKLDSLKPTSLQAYARVETSTFADLAIAKIHITKTAASEEAALDLAIRHRDNIERLIQSLSQNTSEILDRSEGTYRKYACLRYDRFDECDDYAEDSEPFEANVRLQVRFTDLAALQQAMLTIEDYLSTTMYVEWELTPETQYQVKQELRRDSLFALRKVGEEYEAALDVVITGMEYYREVDTYSRYPHWEDVEDDDGSVRIGKVKTAIDVKCLFYTDGQFEHPGSVHVL